MSKDRKNILLISYHYPPSNAVGGLRIVNFVKKLPLFGLNPYVLTIKDQYIENVDADRKKDVRPVKIYKTRKLPTLLDSYLKLKMLYGGILKKRPVMMDDLKASYSSSPIDNTGPESVFQKLKRYFVSLFLVLPDTERDWVIPATLRAVLEIKREKIGYILTSCPPVSVNLIGLLVKIITGVKWVADFRDPWLSSEGKRLAVTCDLSIKIERWMFETVIKKADIVLANTRELRDDFINTYKTIPREKFVFLPNGYDDELFLKYQNLKRYEKFTLTYTGSLYIGRTPEPIFKAVNRLLEDGKVDSNKIKIRLVGNCRNVDGVPMDKIVKSYGLDSVVEVADSVPYSDALQIINQSHIALLFAPGQPFQIPAKVYDYMGAGTKVLALSGEGATANLINDTKIGKSFQATDIDGISEFIHQTVKDTESGNYEIDKSIEEYKIGAISMKLANHLSNIGSD